MTSEQGQPVTHRAALINAAEVAGRGETVLTGLRLSGAVERHPVMSFLALAYTASWILWLPLVVAGESAPSGIGFVLLLLGSLVPSAVALALTALLKGRPGVRALLRQLRQWRVGLDWWASVLLLPGIAVVAVAISVVLGGAVPDVTVAIPGLVVLFAFSIFPGSAGGEEIGWRGFALPHLQAGRSALSASVAVGTAWGVWHLPLYLLGTDERPLSLFGPWVVLTIAASVIYTWLYNGTDGSLLIVVVFHAASNLPLTVLFEPLDDITVPFLIYVALMVLAAVGVVLANGGERLSRTHARQWPVS